MAALKFFERRSLANALSTYLTAAGWTVTIREGWYSDAEVQADTVSVYFLPTAISELQMGRGSKDKGYVRRVQIDCYMSNENKADAIADDIIEFIDMVPVTVKDAAAVDVASMVCYDTSSISAETVPPIMNKPTVLRWRSVIKGTYETHYYND